MCRICEMILIWIEVAKKKTFNRKIVSPFLMDNSTLKFKIVYLILWD